MAEPVIDLNAELERLRTANSELTEKSKTRKQRAAELEAANAALQAQLQQLTVGVPLKQMAEELSVLPELFIEQFSKQYKLELIDGKLTVVNAEDGKPSGVAFERDELFKHLTSEKNPMAKTFKTILIASRASGGAPISNQVTKPHPQKSGLGKFQLQ